MAQVKLKRAGRIHIPDVIREALGWKTGDMLSIEQPRLEADYIIIHKVDQPKGELWEK